MRLLIAIAILVCVAPVSSHAKYSNTPMGRLFACMERATKPHPRDVGARLSVIQSRCQSQRNAVIRDTLASAKPSCNDCPRAARWSTDVIIRVYAENPK